jgi:hypothetical protein
MISPSNFGEKDPIALFAGKLREEYNKENFNIKLRKHASSSSITGIWFNYTKSSTNLEQEYENHSWRIVQGLQLDEPEQGNDHLIDACKYVSNWYARTRYLT